MLRKLNLRGRFTLLIVLPVLMLLLVGGMAWWSATASSRAVFTLHDYSERRLPLEQLDRLIGDALNTLVQQISLGSIGWDPALGQLTRLHDRFETLWQQHLDQLSTGEREQIAHLHRGTVEALRSAFSELSQLIGTRDRVRLRLFILNDYDALTLPYLETLRARIAQQQFAAGQHYRSTKDAVQQRIWIGLGLLGLSLILTIVTWQAVQRSIMQPVGRISTVARAVAIGDYSARVGFSGRDELGKLGQALDRVLDDRQTDRLESERDDRLLKTALEQVLPQLQQLGGGDLSVRLPTDDDTMLVLSSPINQLIRNMAVTLQNARQVADRIEQQLRDLQARTDALTDTAGRDPREVAILSELSGQLDIGLKSLADLARTGAQTVDSVTHGTQTALSAIRQYMSDTPQAPHGQTDQARNHAEQLRQHTGAIRSIAGDLTAAAEQARILELNANLRSASDHNDHALNRDLKALARALRRSEQQILDLGERTETEINHLLTALKQLGTPSDGRTANLKEISARLHDDHQALAELTEALQRIVKESQAHTRISGQLLVHSTQLRTDTEQRMQQLKNQLKRVEALSRDIRTLQQQLQSFRLPSEQSEREPSSVKPA